MNKQLKLYITFNMALYIPINNGPDDPNINLNLKYS